MNQLIWNQYRRWSWLYVTALLAAGIVAGCSVNSGQGRQVFIGLLLQMAMFSGSFTLSMDLQRGLARAVLGLPLTAKQVGQAAWLSSVLIPSLALALVMTLGVAIGTTVKGQGLEHPEFYALAWLLCLSWQGAQFCMLSEMNPANIRSPRAILASSLWGLSMGGCFWFAQVKHLGENNQMTWGIIAGGLVFTLLGWLRAEDLIVQRGSFRAGAQVKSSTPGQFRAPSGFGGLPYLGQTLITRASFMMLAAGGIMLVMFAMMESLKTGTLSQKDLFRSVAHPTSSFIFVFNFMWLVIPMLLALRTLRTLPISTSTLATLLIGLPTATNLAYFSLLAWLADNGQTLFRAMPLCALMALIVPLFLSSKSSQGFFAITMIALTMVSFLANVVGYKMLPPAITTPIAGLLLVLAWVLTKRLLHNSKAYQPRILNWQQGWAGLNR